MLFTLFPWIYLDADKGGGGGSGGGNADDDQDPDKDGADGGAGDDGQQSEDDDEERKFKQSDLNRLFADRAKQGESKGRAAVLKELGVETLEDAQERLKRLKELEDADKTELEKAQSDLEEATKAREKAEADRDAALATANERLMRADVLAEAARQNFVDDALDDVWLVIKNDADLFKSLSVDDDGKVQGAAKAVKVVAEKRKHWLDTGPKVRGSALRRAHTHRRAGAGADNETPSKPMVRL